jgi:hypothetical protein
LKNKNTVENSKIAIYSASIKDVHCPSYRRSHQPSKENIQHFKKSRDPTESGFNPDTDPDPQHWSSVLDYVKFLFYACAFKSRFSVTLKYPFYRCVHP